MVSMEDNNNEVAPEDQAIYLKNLIENNEFLKKWCAESNTPIEQIYEKIAKSVDSYKTKNAIVSYSQIPEIDGEKLTVFAILDQNGNGSSPDYIKEVLGNTIKVIKVPTSLFFPDLGQNRCLNNFKKILS